MKPINNIENILPFLTEKAAKARAYIRLSPRSEKSVAKQLLTLTTEMVVNEA